MESFFWVDLIFKPSSLIRKNALSQLLFQLNRVHYTRMYTISIQIPSLFVGFKKMYIQFVVPFAITNFFFVVVFCLFTINLTRFYSDAKPTIRTASNAHYAIKFRSCVFTFPYKPYHNTVQYTYRVIWHELFEPPQAQTKSEGKKQHFTHFTTNWKRCINQSELERKARHKEENSRSSTKLSMVLLLIIQFERYRLLLLLLFHFFRVSLSARWSSN